MKTLVTFPFCCLRYSTQLIMLSLLFLLSCSETATNNNNNTPTGFTPPTKLLFKVDGVNHSPSMDAVSCSSDHGGVAGLNKPFDGEYTAVRVQFVEAPPSATGYRNISSQVEEGKYKVFYISPDSYTRAVDSVGIELDRVPYYFKATGGRLYVSKLNGKLRYTTDGEITVNGTKYIGPGFSGSYTKKLEFSIQCGEQ